ncbi:helix-turn-helix transcriptional regulator (plasmid) [Ensifer adhaerens]|uniref:helix-turn-helix domain-containing protein n=1 Tax=Ensifer adhaerens TaxID=106592 RepID=UPI0023A9F94B|nr:helix-turn-helix transcriptional regulator [Ensifer adhaerens]WDZ81474.1 helix-turn-helix transcriptional regulator [Ensifer adhaerens]
MPKVEDTTGNMQRNFAENLRLACSYERSVSDLCRNLEINRSQFNRYMRAAARPSPNILNRLCDHFGVEATEFHLPPEHFTRIIALRRRTVKPRPPYADTVDRLRTASLPTLRSYAGYYHVYYYSMSSPGMILRGLMHIFTHDNDVYYRRIERFPGRDSTSEAFKCRYTGTALFLEDRIFLIDVESLTGNEITQTILFPSRRNRIGRLTGLVMGVSSNSQRKIACSRVLLEWLGTEIAIRPALARCGLFSPETAEIAPSIRDAIDNSRDPATPLFYPLDV